jgi:L-idonate 5-dehydrogenase
MKVVVIHAARDLRVEEREPEIPARGQVEVTVEAGGICGSDLHYFNYGGFGTNGVSRLTDKEIVE